MSKILVPTDFSSLSDRASEAALSLAAKADLEVMYIHLLSTTADDIMNEKERSEFHRLVLKEVTEKSRKLDMYVDLARVKYVRADKVLNYDRHYTSLVEYTENNQVELILMGTHGLRGAREYLVGSHSQMVARISQIPVLVIKEGYDLTEPAKMTFLSDFEDPPGEGFKKAIKLAGKLGLQIDLVYINSRSNFRRNRELYTPMNEYADLCPDMIDRMDIFSSQDLETGVDEYATLYGTDMIAMVTHQREGTSKVNMNSLTERLINHSKVPILSLHN